MANTLIKTTATKIGKITLAEGSSADRYFQIYAYFTRTERTAKVYVQLYFSSTSAINGSGKVTVNSNNAENFNFSKGSTFTTQNPITVTYTTNGVCQNKSLKVTLSNMSATWGAGDSFDATPQNTIDIKFDLPNINPVPTFTLNSVQIKSNGYIAGSNTLIVAGITTIRTSITVTYASSATLTVKALDGNNKVINTTSYNLAVTEASSETITKDFIPFATSSDYTLNFYISASNGTGTKKSGDTPANVQSIKGYSIPTYDSGTYVQRCDQSGNVSATGEYGRLYLTWKLTEISASYPNTLQSCSVYLNNSSTALTVTDGSISSGYLDYIFPLATNTQGNLSIYLEDKVANSNITSFVVAKQIMPLSLYQNGDTVGVAIGQMATKSGFWCFGNFYLKSSTANSTKMFRLRVYDDGTINVVEATP